MKQVLFRGQIPICVDGLPDDSDRSVKGAIHLKPGCTLELTDDEYSFIKANRPDVSKHVIVVKDF